MLSFFNKFNRTSTKSKKAKKSQSTFMYIVCAILSKDDSPKPKKENASDLSYLKDMYAPGSVYAKPGVVNKYDFFIPIPNDSIDYDALPTIEESLAAINAKYPDLEKSSRTPKRSPVLSTRSSLSTSTSNSSLISYASSTSTKISQSKSKSRTFKKESSKTNDKSYISSNSSLESSSYSPSFSSSSDSLPCNHWLNDDNSDSGVNYFSIEC